MNMGNEHFARIAPHLRSSEGGRFDGASPRMTQWLQGLDVPSELKAFFLEHSPKTEIWAGAGFLFDEESIVRRNTEHTAALRTGFFIVGSAPNGDLIVIDIAVGEGTVGYVMHDKMWETKEWRDIYVPVCPSLGEYLLRINTSETDLPNDYFDATTGR